MGDNRIGTVYSKSLRFWSYEAEVHQMLARSGLELGWHLRMPDAVKNGIFDRQFMDKLEISMTTVERHSVVNEAWRHDDDAEPRSGRVHEDVDIRKETLAKMSVKSWLHGKIAPNSRWSAADPGSKLAIGMLKDIDIRQETLIDRGIRPAYNAYR